VYIVGKPVLKGPGARLAPGHFREEDITMEQIVTKLVSEFEQGKLSRRQLIKNLTLAVTAGSALSAVPAAAADDKMVPAIYINHVSYQVTDYTKTRDFYAGLFGMKVVEDDGKTQCRLLFGDNILAVRNAGTRPDKKLGVDHIAYTIADWDAEKDAYLAEIKRRGVKLTGASDILDPDGFRVQFGGYKQ
jgi:catechol 2,3-dioxygenase-like lactoylglutathione lyase family enzyme